MNDRQRIDLDSARLVLAFLLANAAIVDSEEDIKKLRDYLLVTIPKVDAAAAIQIAGRGGAKDFKDNLKTEGSEIGKKWLTALKTVSAPADFDLAGVVNKSPSIYERLDDNSWYQFNLVLIEKAKQYKTNVAKYGRTEAEIQSLKDYNDAFVTAMTKPEQVTQLISKATDDVEAGITGINDMARDTDRFVKAYEDVHPEFVRTFLESRRKKG